MFKEISIPFKINVEISDLIYYFYQISSLHETLASLTRLQITNDAIIIFLTDVNQGYHGNEMTFP